MAPACYAGASHFTGLWAFASLSVVALGERFGHLQKRQRPAWGRWYSLRCTRSVNACDVSSIGADHGTMYSLHRDCLSIPSVLSLRSDRRAAASSFGGIDRGKLVSHFDVRVFGRAYSLQRDSMEPAPELGWCWSHRETADCVRYHCGRWVLYVNRADSGRRVDLEWGRFALSF